jgi:hypothetical protein
MNHRTRLSHLVLVIICAAALAGASGGTAYPSLAAPAATTRYVIPGGMTSGTCTSWATACDLQYALGVAVSGDEVWVKAGTHKPTTGSDRSATFQLRNGVALYGGFAGTETARGQRNWTANVTILSGDIGAAGNNSDNSYHVVTAGSGTNGTAILDGFTVTGGNANGSSDPDDKGGGMYNYYGNPTVQNVIFSVNTAKTFGGGMHNSHSSPTLVNVTFSGNTVTNGDGGGMVNTDSSAPTLTNVAFLGNSVTGGNGGGMLNDFSSPTLINVTFANNSTTGGDGGALYNDLVSTPVLTNVTFYSNTATMSSIYNGGNGGAIYNYATSNYTMTHVTFSGNRAVGYDAGHPAHGGAMVTVSGNATVRNAIFWGNTPDQVYNDSGTTTVGYSVVQGGYPGPGIITTDPLLGAPGNYGGYVTTVPLLPGSSAIDTANDAWRPATDARGVARPQGPHGDIGAFESSRFTLAITGGNNQSTLVNTTFAQPLRVSVTPNNAAEPVNGGKVTFTPPASGPSASLVTSPATIANGAASVNATANGFRGAYVVAASTVGGNAVLFNLRNTGVYYVKTSATGASDCSSWANACMLQTALGSAGVGDEIWVAAGTYQPTTGSDPNATFALPNDVGVYGGFAGSESARSQRNWTTHVTTLSGNLSGGAHSLHVVTANGTALATTLDGFTVTGGQGGGGGGGVLILDHSSLTIANCRITDNSANLGGGVYQEGEGQVVLINSLVERNHAGSQGGGLFITDYVALTNTLVLTNTANADGGGLMDWEGFTRLTGGKFAGNSAGGNGGGVNVNGGIVVSGTQFISNTAGESGGGLLQWIAGGYSIIITNARFERNTASIRGGGASVSSTLTISNSTFVTNTVNSGNANFTYGGGVYAGGTSRIYASTFVSNSAISVNSFSYGGGLYARAAAMIQDSTFDSNQASTHGGGVYGNYVAINVSRSVFKSNRALWGGAINAFAAITITRSSFLDNRANLYGGGITGYRLDVANVLLAGNQAGLGGAALGLSNGNSALRHVTIAHPSLGSGPAILMTGGTATVTDTIIAGYTVGISQTSGTLSADYDLLFTTTPTQTSGGTMNWGTHNLNANPLFVNPAAGDYHLTAHSPAINAGTNVGVAADLDGIARPQGAGFDIGAYEYRFVVCLPLVVRSY